ncbi:FRIGIDA-like protein 4a [Euphorbia lathyris]|uniref:FRIGIDA-like protein 4a n=1 Tax=Euphorbia lathyris TaxID=212925 RepID=UPI0033143706
MATEVAINTDRTQKFIDHLEAQKTVLSSCTQLFTTLTAHFTSLQNSLSQKCQTLDSKFQSLETNSHQTLESLSQRETSIPERESVAAAKVHEQKENALAEFQKPFKFDNLSDALKSFSRRMDSSGLLKFVMSKRKESVSLRAEISSAIMEAVDPAVLILDAVDEFVSNKIEKLGVTDKRWACGLLVQVLFPEGGRKQKEPEFGRNVVERAAKILNRWMEEQVGGDVGVGSGGSGGGVWGPAEAVMFLQMVVAFGLKSRFDEGFLMKLVMEHASRRDMARLAVAIGFGEKMGEIIDELVKNEKELEAVYFAYESGLTERFSPVSLLKSYMRNSKKNTFTVMKNGNFSAAATDESNTVELNSIKAVIKCVEDHKLESEFSLDVLRKRATRLEKTKAERKKSSAAAAKSKNKRSHGASSSSRSQKPPAFRPAKVAKFSNNTTYPPFGRRNPAPIPQHSPVARYSGLYNYPTQSVVYDGHSTTSYPTTYGASHSQTPAAITQQHYPLSAENASGVASFRTGASYGVQANYVTYDYGTAAPPAYQPSSYTQ